MKLFYWMKTMDFTNQNNARILEERALPYSKTSWNFILWKIFRER